MTSISEKHNSRIRELDKILNDNKSGSLEILLKFKNHLLKYYSDSQYLMIAIKKAGLKLEHFPAVQEFIKSFKSELKKSDALQIKKFLQHSVSEQNNLLFELFNRHKNILLKYQKVTTISFSKTLLEIFKFWHKENPELEIFILESRPNSEGRILAKELLKLEIKCYFLVDAMMNYAVQNSDCVLIGADQILRNNNVVNKIGSYPLALCAKDAKKPFYVLATKNKITSKVNFFADTYSSNEIWKFRNKNLEIINHYFEEIPKRLITRILL